MQSGKLCCWKNSIRYNSEGSFHYFTSIERYVAINWVSIPHIGFMKYHYNCWYIVLCSKWNGMCIFKIFIVHLGNNLFISTSYLISLVTINIPITIMSRMCWGEVWYLWWWITFDVSIYIDSNYKIIIIYPMDHPIGTHLHRGRVIKMFLRRWRVEFKLPHTAISFFWSVCCFTSIHQRILIPFERYFLCIRKSSFRRNIPLWYCTIDWMVIFIFSFANYINISGRKQDDQDNNRYYSFPSDLLASQY